MKIHYYDGIEDDRYDAMVVRYMDDERDAREDHCPECGGEEIDSGFIEAAASGSVGCDTSYRYCLECGHRWGFE